MGVIFACAACVISRILLAEKAQEGRQFVRMMQTHVLAPELPVEDDAESDVVLPPKRRTRTRYPARVTIDWDAAGPDERAQAALAVLPIHYEDSNGITATDVAHRLGLDKANRVTPALRSLVKSGDARQHWDKANRRRKVYWRTSS